MYDYNDVIIPLSTDLSIGKIKEWGTNPHSICPPPNPTSFSKHIYTATHKPTHFDLEDRESMNV
jgi:hypothetical protein